MLEKYHQNQIKPLSFASPPRLWSKKTKIFSSKYLKLLGGDEENSKISSDHINNPKQQKSILRILDMRNYIYLCRGMKEKN